MTATSAPVPVTAETRTERRKRETHERLLDTILELIMDGEQLSTRLIAERADVAVGTFYNHFDDVEGAIDEAFGPLRRKFDGWVAQVAQAANPMRAGCEVVALFLRE